MNFQNRKTVSAGVRLGLLLVTIRACHVAASGQQRKLQNVRTFGDSEEINPSSF